MAAAVALAVGSVTFAANGAGAQTCYPPTPGCVTTSSSTRVTAPRLTLSATTVARGQTVGATISGFQPGTSGILTIRSVEQQIGSFTMPASGAASSSITIPTTISLGAHTVFARGTVAGGQAGEASQAVTVVAAGTIGTGTTSTSGGTGSSLARTGAYVLGVGVVGLGLVLAGVALMRSGKRGKARSSA